MTAVRVLAFLGAVFVAGTIDGVITGTIAAFWGDLNGCRYGDVVSGSVAVVAVWQWTGGLKS